VRPAMVGTLETAGVAASLRHLDAAVDAHVVVGRELALAGAGDDDRLAGDAHGHVVAGVRQFLDSADIEPVTHEKLLDIEPVELRRGVHGTGRVTGFGERSAHGGYVDR